MGGFSTRGYYPRTEIIGDRARLMLRLMAPSWTARWSSPAPSRRLACTWRGGDVVTAGCRWLCCAVFLLGVCVLSVALSSWFGFVGLGMGLGSWFNTALNFLVGSDQRARARAERSDLGKQENAEVHILRCIDWRIWPLADFLAHCWAQVGGVGNATSHR